MLCADGEASSDLEIGQTSELVALAQNACSTYDPPSTDSRWLSDPAKTASQQRIHQLQELCASISTDEGIQANIRDVCAALQHNLSEAAVVP